MGDVLFRIGAFLRYCVAGRHRRGFGVQSPFVFRLLNFVVFEDLPYYAYDSVERLRRSLLESDERVYVEDCGTGRSGVRAVSDIACKSLESPKYGQLLFRLVNYFRPRTILELGTSLGVTTLYLALPSSGTRVVTIEGAAKVADIARGNFVQMGVENVAVVVRNIDGCLEDVVEGLGVLDFVYIDANHTRESVLRYFDICAKGFTGRSVVVLDDIHYSRGMEEAWNVLKRREDVRVSIDLFHVGLLLFEESLPKQDYVVAF